MPYIKPRAASRFKIFLSSREGELCLVTVIGGLFQTVLSAFTVRLCVFVSETLYPFTYPFFHTPLHAFLPESVTETNLIYSAVFSALFAVLIYYFEKNIFYRRFPLFLKVAFASVAACVYVYILGLFSVFIPIPTPEAGDLLALFVYNYLTLIPLFLFSDQIRRRIFMLP